MPGDHLTVGVATLACAYVAGEWSGPTDDRGFGLALAIATTMDDPCVRIGHSNVANLERAVQQMALSRALIVQDEWDKDGGWRGLVEDH